MPTGRLLGVLLALTSATCFGVMPVLTKVAYADGADPVAVLAARFVLATALLLALTRLRGERLPTGRPLAWLLAIGGVVYVAQSLCYFLALERISAGLTALLLYFHPALVVMAAAVLARSWPRPVAVACVTIATLGTALTVGPVGAGRVTGVLLGLGSALAYTVYVLASSRVRGVGPLASATTVLGAAAVTYSALALATGPQFPTAPSAWVAVLGVAVLGTVVAVTTFFAALALLGPGDTAVVSTVEPVVSITVAFLVLGELLGPLQIAGGVLVLLAVGVLARVRPPEKVPAPV